LFPFQTAGVANSSETTANSTEATRHYMPTTVMRNSDIETQFLTTFGLRVLVAVKGPQYQ